MRPTTIFLGKWRRSDGLARADSSPDPSTTKQKKAGLCSLISLGDIFYFISVPNMR